MCRWDFGFIAFSEWRNKTGNSANNEMRSEPQRLGDCNCEIYVNAFRYLYIYFFRMVTLFDIVWVIYMFRYSAYTMYTFCQSATGDGISAGAVSIFLPPTNRSNNRPNKLPFPCSIHSVATKKLYVVCIHTLVILHSMYILQPFHLQRASHF